VGEGVVRRRQSLRLVRKRLIVQRSIHRRATSSAVLPIHRMRQQYSTSSERPTPIDITSRKNKKKNTKNKHSAPQNDAEEHRRPPFMRGRIA
jgi:hypothetical protein